MARMIAKYLTGAPYPEAARSVLSIGRNGSARGGGPRSGGERAGAARRGPSTSLDGPADAGAALGRHRNLAPSGAPRHRAGGAGVVGSPDAGAQPAGDARLRSRIRPALQALRN